MKMQTRTKVMLLAVLGALVAAAAAIAAERGGGIKIGGGGGGIGGGARDGGRGGGVRIGGDGIRRARTSPAPPPPRAPSVITAALVVPHKAFGTRDYTKAEKAALAKLPRKLKLFSHVRLNITLSTQGLTPSPMCKCLSYVSVYVRTYNQQHRSTNSVFGPKICKATKFVGTRR